MQGLKAAIEDYPEWDLVVAGHSLGAAAGIFAAADLRKLYGDEKTVTLVCYLMYSLRRWC